MMNLHLAILPASVLLAVALPGCASADKPKDAGATASTQAPEAPLTVEDSIEVSVTAKVKSIDHATRIVTLRDDRGHEVTFAVDEGVRRLNEVRAGDDVSARYKATLLAELRPPTAEEAENPISVVGIGGRSPQGTAPAGGVAHAVRIVTIVEAVDVPNMLVTLRGPMGDLAVVRGRKPENVRRLRVGDTIVITMTESLAIALEKIAPR
jgi:hypothetical protein